MLKKYLLCLLLAVIAAFALNATYEKYMKPDSLFFEKCIRATERWNHHLRKIQEPCYVFAGHSGVRMSIDTKTMLETHGVRAVNAGVQAGNGIRCNVQIALPFLQKGDTLLLCCSPSNFEQKKNGMSHGGINFCRTIQGYSPYVEGIIPCSYYTIASLFRGASTNYAIHATRILTRPNCIYRYSSPQNAQITESGRVEVFLLNEQNIVIDEDININRNHTLKPITGWESFINELKAYCINHGVKLAMYIPRDHASKLCRRNNAFFALHFVEMGIPVVKDPYLGAWNDATKFSDTAQHLSIEGGREFSEFLALQLKNQQYWTKEELLQIIYP